MNHLWNVILLFVQVLSCLSMKACESEKSYLYYHFGIRTGYNFVANENGINRNTECHPTLIWMIMRQGVSWPSEETLNRLRILHKLKEDILQNHYEGRGELCESDLKLLKETDFPPNTATPGSLTGQGRLDTEQLVETLKQGFPELFQKSYSDEDFEVRYASLPGVLDTAKCFTSSLFGSDFNFDLIHGPAEIDKMLNGPNICDNWREKNFYGRAWLLVYTLIMKHKALRSEVSKRLGFKKTLDFESVVVMYIGCSLQKAMNPTGSPSWCFVFNFEQLRLLRYMEDSFYYKACGPGEDTSSSSLNKFMTCQLYNDLIAKLSGARGRHLQHSFYFTDEKTLLLLLNGLGYLDHMTISDVVTAEQRTFRTSSMTPFGANLASVLYKCGTDNFRIGFYLNGHPLRRPGQEELLEPWGEFRDRIHRQYLTTLLCHADHCPAFTSHKFIEDTSIKVFYQF